MGKRLTSRGSWTTEGKRQLHRPLSREVPHPDPVREPNSRKSVVTVEFKAVANDFDGYPAEQMISYRRCSQSAPLLRLRMHGIGHLCCLVKQICGGLRTPTSHHLCLPLQLGRRWKPCDSPHWMYSSAAVPLSSRFVLVAHEDFVLEVFGLDDDRAAFARAFDDRLEELRLNAPLAESSRHRGRRTRWRRS
ncbi:MAG: hypothetical protein KatS3mg038_2941 [Candidatus Kapaibacterium sp.]|nr:MAG: hypothetical protein KatS3mg038_2941 [Candidatus Kapabacteria bacterium]